MTQLARSASLTGFAELARRLGLDPLRLAAECGIPAPALADPDLRIPASAVGRLLETAAERAGVDNLGLRLAETRKFSNMGAVAVIARDQPSLRKALEVMAQYQWMQSEGLSLAIEEHRDIAILHVHIAGGRVARQATELSLGVLCRNLQALMGNSWRPLDVVFRHAPPLHGDVHRRLFGVTPQFDGAMDGLVIARGELDRPLPAADPVLARHAETYLRQLAARRTGAERDVVGELILLLLPTGTCTAERAARHLGVDRRTLHRRLAREGTDFTTLMEEKRGELVRSLIGDNRRSLLAIAQQCGFAGASAFSHWFRRRFGTTPRAYRSGLRAKA